MQWLLSLWQGREIALALDASLKGADHVCLCLSVLYRGTATPVAWKILPANRQGVWLCHLQEMIRSLRSVVPKSQRVLLLADRGLWSPDLWDTVRAQGWHPMVRVQEFATFQAETGLRGPMSQYVPGAGHAWVGRGQAFTHRRKAATLVVVFALDQKAPWCLLTDLPVDAVPVMAYGLRVWIEAGFRALKSLGWQWDRVRRTDPVRLGRYFLVVSVATLWVLSTGTRVEDAQQQGISPAALRRPVPIPKKILRTTSVFKQGLVYLQRQFSQGRVWARVWMTPEPYPPLPERLQLSIVRST